MPDVDIVVMLDGEGADDLTDLDRFVAPVVDGEADLVIGAQSDRQRSRLMAAMLDLLYGDRVAGTGPMQVIRRSVLVNLDMRETSGGWAIEMIAKVARRGMRVQYVNLRPQRESVRRAGLAADRGVQGLLTLMRARRSVPRAS